MSRVKRTVRILVIKREAGNPHRACIFRAEGNTYDEALHHLTILDADTGKVTPYVEVPHMVEEALERLREKFAGPVVE